MGQPAGMATYHADSRTAPFFHTKVLKLKMWSEKLFFTIPRNCPFNNLRYIRWWATTSPPVTSAERSCISLATFPLMMASLPHDEPPQRPPPLTPIGNCSISLATVHLAFNDLFPTRWWATTTSSHPITPAGRCSISHVTVPLIISSRRGDELLLRVLILSPQLEAVRYLTLLSL